MLHNQVTIAQTGVRKQLGSGTTSALIQIKAFSTNTGSVFIGSSAVTSGNGFELTKGEYLIFADGGSLANVYIIGQANDKVCYIEQDAF